MLIFTTVLSLYAISLWYFRHDTRQWRAENVKSAEMRLVVWLTQLIAPLVSCYLLGFRMLRRLDRRFGNNADLPIEKYRNKKWSLDFSGEKTTILPFMMGAVIIVPATIGFILGAIDLEPHVPQILHNIGEVLTKIGS